MKIVISEFVFLKSGSLRYFEMRKKGYEQNFIRFPLFPGSLLIMEGATQEDWLHQVSKSLGKLLKIT